MRCWTAFSPTLVASGVKQRWSTSGIGKTGQNVLLYSNPKVDALLDSVTTAFDPAKMRQYASRAFQQIIDDTPAIWLYDIVVVDAVQSTHQCHRYALGRMVGEHRRLDDRPDKRIDRDRIGLATPKP